MPKKKSRTHSPKVPEAQYAIEDCVIAGKFSDVQSLLQLHHSTPIPEIHVNERFLNDIVIGNHAKVEELEKIFGRRPDSMYQEALCRCIRRGTVALAKTIMLSYRVIPTDQTLQKIKEYYFHQQRLEAYYDLNEFVGMVKAHAVPLAAKPSNGIGNAYK